MTDETFLAAIDADPADDVHRLVYADWLEERGDPRAEYIRLRLRAGRRDRARLAALRASVDVEWRMRAFAVPKLSIKQRRVTEPITEPVTKFGGQPVWVGEPAWPAARRDGPMQFVCQVAMPAFLGPGLSGKMAYVFAVHPPHEARRQFCGRISPLYPEQGDNAVVIQPGGDAPAPTFVLPLGAKGQRRKKRPVKVERRATGPTLYDDEGKLGEWAVDLVPGVDPDYTPNGRGTFPSEESWEKFMNQVEGQKIGGTPSWGNGRASEIDSLAVDPEWRLVLSYDRRSPHFTVWSSGFEWYVWATRDGKRGFLMGGR